MKYWSIREEEKQQEKMNYSEVSLCFRDNSITLPITQVKAMKDRTLERTLHDLKLF